MTDFCDGLFASLCVACATVSSLFTFFRYALPLSCTTPSMALSVHRDHQAHRATPAQCAFRARNTRYKEEWLMDRDAPVGVRIDALPEFDQRGIVFSIGHRCVESCQLDFCSFSEYVTSIIGLLGASPHISPPSSPDTSSPTSPTLPATPVPSSVYFRVKCRCARQRSRRARRSTTTRRCPRLLWAAL